jgi:hypothetical protein
LKRVAIRKVGRDIAAIGDRNIWTFFSQLDVVAVVFESVREQTGSAIFAASHSGKQHESPPKEINPGHSTNGGAVPVVVSLWKNVDRFYALYRPDDMIYS